MFSDGMIAFLTDLATQGIRTPMLRHSRLGTGALILMSIDLTCMPASMSARTKLVPTVPRIQTC